MGTEEASSRKFGGLGRLKLMNTSCHSKGCKEGVLQSRGGELEIGHLSALGLSDPSNGEIGESTGNEFIGV